MTYNANRLAALDKTKPLGSEAPSILDDALREVKIAIADELVPALPLMQIRAQFVYVDVNIITLSGLAVYHHKGTVEQLIYWDGTLTFTFGPTGSNPGSDGLPSSDFSYLYLDDSAIVSAGTNIITAAQLVNKSQAPTWNSAKGGWYDGNDKCIFAVRTGSGSNILAFHHDGGDYCQYVDAYVVGEINNIQPGATPATCKLEWMPAFSTRAYCMIRLRGPSNYWAFYRITGDTTSAGIRLGLIEPTEEPRITTHMPIFTSANQQIDVYWSSACDNYMYFQLLGWFFPRGM